MKNENLFWLEVSGEKSIRVMQCPKNTREKIISLFFENKPLATNTYSLLGGSSQKSKIQSIIFTSATLSNGVAASDKEKYSYFIENTGFPVENNGEEYIKTPIPSPFPYDKHAMIYYAENLPHPTRSRQEFNQKGVRLAIEILKITEGRGLMLFTAKTDLDEVYYILCGENLPFKILRQSRNSSQEKVLDDFRKDIHSVLLGTGAFWEGIDIPGESLSNVIIFRLPFPVKDTIIEYKHEIAKEKNMLPIMSVDVPEMIIKLKQGIGRLIRNESDKGIVSILDPRLGSTFPREYQETVWRSLPIKNRTSDIKELGKFFESIVNHLKT
jgi:ATP-dependent DNA helicase DinG